MEMISFVDQNMSRNDGLLVALGCIGVAATALLVAPIPVGCCGLPLYFIVFASLSYFATSTTYRSFRETTSLQRMFLIVFLWACLFAMLPLFAFAVHAVGWLMTR